MRKHINKLLTLGLCSLALCSFAEEKKSYPEGEKVLFVRGKVEVKQDGKKRKVTEHKDQWGVKRYRIPHITKTPDGRLVVAIVGRCSKGGDHGKSTSFFAVSKDEGETWEYIRHNTDYANMKNRPTTDFPLTERTQETQVLWYPAMNKFVAAYLTKNACWFTTSEDLKVWSKPVKASFFGDDKLKYWPSPASIQIGTDGSLMVALTGTERVDDKSQRFSRLLWTKDLKTFTSSSSMPCKGNETAFCPIGDGNYFVTTRIRPKRLNMIYTKDGDKWSEPKPFPQPAHWRCEVDVINDDGTLYLTTPTKGRAQGVLYKSTDKGTSWEKVKLLTETGFAYSSLVKINDTTLGIVAERDGGDIVFQKVNVK